MKYKYLFVVMFLTGNILAAQRVTQEKMPLDQNPERAAFAVIKEGKVVFLAVRGYNTFVPGLDNLGCYVQREYVQVLLGPTDAWQNSRQQQQWQANYDFALKFNTTMKNELVQQQKPLPCERDALLERVEKTGK